MAVLAGHPTQPNGAKKKKKLSTSIQQAFNQTWIAGAMISDIENSCLIFLVLSPTKLLFSYKSYSETKVTKIASI